MTRPNAAILVVIIAIALAGAATWGVYDYLKKSEKRIGSLTGQSVVVAAVDIPIGTKINASQLKTTTLPKANVPQGSFADPKTVDGRIAVRHIYPDDTVTEQKLMPAQPGAAAEGIMTYLVPDGHRAVTVAVNEVAGVAGFLAPGNKVDVVLTTVPPGTTDPISKIVLQDVPILATGQITEQKEGKPVIVPTVTLDLSPEDSEKLVLSSSKGSLQLLLRNIMDTQPVETKGATIARVLGRVERPVTRKAAPVRRHHSRPVVMRHHEPPAPAPYSVEIVKGTSKSTRQYPQGQ